jgi:mitochondrial fission protein ELM1
VAAPRHDHVRGENVVETLGALNRVTPDRLQAAAAHFAPPFAHLPRPLAAVLIGGSSGAYRLTPKVTGALCDGLADLTANGAGLAVTPSRRTGEANVGVLRHRLAGPAATVWDDAGENPYFGLLGLADALIVTCDSVSMASEACATGKPVYIVDLPGGSRKFREFHTGLRAAGMTRPFAGTLESWTYPPLTDTARVAAEVARHMPR